MNEEIEAKARELYFVSYPEKLLFRLSEQEYYVSNALAHGYFQRLARHFLIGEVEAQISILNEFHNKQLQSWIENKGLLIADSTVRDLKSKLALLKGK